MHLEEKIEVFKSKEKHNLGTNFSFLLRYDTFENLCFRNTLL